MTYSEVIKCTGHSYAATVTTEATCTTGGEKTFTCTKCKDSYTTTVPPGHTWVAATCTTPRHCSVCGETPIKTVAGHTYDAKGYCTQCKEFFIELPEVPTTVYHGVSYYIYSAVKITSITPTKKSNTSFEFLFEGECVFIDASDISQSSPMWFGYKLYDEDGYVVASGTPSTTALAPGDKFKKAVQVSGLNMSKTYRLELLNVT